MIDGAGDDRLTKAIRTSKGLRKYIVGLVHMNASRSKDFVDRTQAENSPWG